MPKDICPVSFTKAFIFSSPTNPQPVKRGRGRPPLKSTVSTEKVENSARAYSTMFFAKLPSELRLQVCKELASDKISRHNLSETCRQAYKEITFCLEKVFKIYFQALDQLRRYIETRTSISLQHPHDITVLYYEHASMQT